MKILMLIGEVKHQINVETIFCLLLAFNTETGSIKLSESRTFHAPPVYLTLI